ncbi:hypothetical protein ACOSP7_022713 [Xanthoceras sorbifolium]
MERAKIEMENRVVDLYKASPAFDAFMHREFRNNIKEYRYFLHQVASLEALEKMDRVMANNEGLPKIYANDKAGSNILGAKIDKGPDPDFDYTPLFSEGKEDLILNGKEESEGESNEDQIPLSMIVRQSSLKGKDIGQSFGHVDASQNPDPPAK